MFEICNGELLIEAVQIVSNRLFVVFDELLVEQGTVLEKFLEFALSDLVQDLLRLAFLSGLFSSDLNLLFDGRLVDAVLIYSNRFHSGDLHGHVAAGAGSGAGAGGVKGR